MRDADSDPGGARSPGPLLHPGDPAAAAMLLSRLPVPAWATFGAAGAMRGAASAWAWPLLGALVAGLAWLAGAGLIAAGLPAGLAAGVALGAAVMLTGALHEDGLADCADGLWGGATPARRLEILRDSRIGSYGVIALVFGLGLRWGALAELFAAGNVLAGWVAVAMLSRAGMGVAMRALPFARQDGLAAHVGRPGWATSVLGAGLALAAALALLGGAGLAAALAVSVGVAGVAMLARRRLGGQTGDVLGAAQQASEVLGLLTLVALLT
jgi:adenosylcobinamide-GDP ribazoletransferase